MLTPTLGQIERLIGLLEELGVTKQQLQKFLGAGDIVKLLITHSDELQKINRWKLAKLLNPQLLHAVSQSSIDELTQKIQEENDRNLWNLTSQQTIDLAEEVLSYKDPSQAMDLVYTIVRARQGAFLELD